MLFDGDTQRELFMVKSGIACLYDDSGAKRNLIDFAYQNRFCADFISFSSQSPSKYCIECLSDCEVAGISYPDLQRAFDQSPAIERAYRLLLERMLVAALKKNIIDRTYSMEERFTSIMNKKPELFQLVPHKYIASYANMDVTNFSKLYNQYCVNNGLQYE